MELVKAANVVYDIEKKHFSMLHKLNFLGFNVWQIYRNFIIYKQLEGQGPQKKKVIADFSNKKGLLRGFIQLFKKRKSVRNKVVLYSSSFLYTKSEDGSLSSALLVKLAQEIGRDKVVAVATCIDGAGHERSEPPIVFDDMPFYKSRFTVILCVFLLPVIMRHYRVLGRFTNMTRRQVARQLVTFFERYCYYYLLTKILRPRTVILYQSSYGSEAAVAAMKALGVTVYEYQHGQLFKEHYGYNFCRSLCAVKDRMVLPDKMLIYGNYWKDVMLDEQFFDEDFFLVCGHPMMSSAQQINVTCSPKEPVVVFTSGYAADQIRSLIANYLAESKYAEKYQWIIKPHPRENPGEWQDFVQKYDTVELTEEDTYDLLKSVKIVITLSPSMLYESTYYGNSVYCFFPGVDLHDSKSNPFTSIREIEGDFIEPFDSEQQVCSSEQFYDEFSFKYFLTIIE